MEHRTLKISGVSVLFPCKPYPSQLSMMDKVIKGIDRRQNCLLESPTGSGKSLALLCSSLAWQAEEKAKKEQDDALFAEKALCSCECHQKIDVPKEEVSRNPTKNGLKEGTNLEVSKPGSDMPISVDDKDDFRADSFHLNKASFHSDSKNSKRHITVSYEGNEEPAKQDDSPIDANIESFANCPSCLCSPDNKPKRKVPKIYFGTRTHKQVAQIVRELRKTSYLDVKMTILGSREHTCIHPEVSKMKKKNEGCKELLNGPGCPLKDRAQRYMSHDAIKNQGLDSAWDLEDLIKVCRPKKVCPYFLSRGLKEDADVIICPYNYLVDPLIRDAMMINLKGHIVIFDEAHNIEDSSREAASQTISQESISSAMSDIEVLMESHNLADYSKLLHVLKKLDSFIDENKDKLEQKDFNQSYKIWNGFYIVAQLENLGMGPKHFPDLKSALAAIKRDGEERKEEALRQGWNPDMVEMKPATLNLLDQLFMVMDYLYRSDMKYVEDYRASLVHSVSYTPKHTEGQWLNSRSRNTGRMIAVDNLNLNFWCMNPGVAFSDFGETRSVILTSGTLSPLASFQSELGVDFKIQLEANHVIKDSQVWVGTLGQGPSGTSLQAVYRNLETYAFQDELGNLVLKVCESTGVMSKMRERKVVLREPHGSDKGDFELRMQQFYDAVSERGGNPLSKTDQEESCTTGAIMFAVCRGKVSEGLDFADDFARAVISVGIPYPNFKDVQVELKRKYNDNHSQSRGLLSGHAWYEIQAFRALNQALGRCIRHRNDWGALIIVDDRFVKNPQKYCQGLSKWVRNKIRSFGRFGAALNSLTDFVSQSEKIEEENRASDIEKSILSPPPTPEPKTSVMNSSPYFNKAPIAKAIRPSTPIAAKNFSIFDPFVPRGKAFHQGKQNRNHDGGVSRTSKPVSDFQRINEQSSSALPGLSPVSIPSLMSSTMDSSAILQGAESLCDIPQPRTTTTLLPPNRFAVMSKVHKAPNSNVPTRLNPGVKISVMNKNMDLRIITDIAAPGESTLVVRLPKHLHPVFGGDLILPVSSSERRVYIVKPPLAEGKPPVASVIKATDEEIDSQTAFSMILSKNGDQEKIVELPIGPMDNASASPPEIKSLSEIATEEYKLKTESSLLEDDKKPCKDFCTSESETESACVVDSISNNSNSNNNNIGSPNTSNQPNLVSGGNANPFLRFSHLGRSKKICHESSKDETHVNVTESSAIPSPILFSPESSGQSGKLLQKEIASMSSKKPLFKRKKPMSSEEEDLTSANDESSVTAAAPSHVNQNEDVSNVRITLSKEINKTSEEVDSDFSTDFAKEDKLIVKRKNRRRSSSLKRASEKKIKKENCLPEDEIKSESSSFQLCTTSFSCLSCGSNFFDKPASDFVQHKITPPFLCRDVGDCKKSGCIFFHTSPSIDSLQPLTEGLPGPSLKYIEQEEICVQFLYCSSCLKEWTAQKSESPRPVGANVQLAAGSGARFRKGQLWLFLHAVEALEMD